MALRILFSLSNQLPELALPNKLDVHDPENEFIIQTGFDIENHKAPVVICTGSENKEKES